MIQNVSLFYIKNDFFWYCDKIIRVDRMVEEGLIEEVKALYEDGTIGRNAAAAIGYKELLHHFKTGLFFSLQKKMTSLHKKRGIDLWSIK